MSRRARLEEEKLKQLNEELAEEENRIKAQFERIYAPIVWKRLSSGIRIEDLKPSYYDQVLQIIQECYLQEEVLCRNTNLADDPSSVKSFQQQVLFNLKDRTSIIAIDEPSGSDEKKSEGTIAGFLVLKAVHKDDYGNVFSRVLPTEGEAIKKCMEFWNYIGKKADVYGTLDCEVFLKYCLLCIKPEYRKRGLGFQLMLTGIDVARSLNIPVVMGLFSCYTLQKLAKKLGMKVIFEINYVSWRDRFNELIFQDPGVGNYSCTVMAGHVPPPPVYEPPPKKDDEEPVKLTREEKRKAKAKLAKKKGG